MLQFSRPSGVIWIFKFIGSGASAKAILYYITNYITKSQLKAHIAYAALELAVGKLGEYNPQDDDLTVHTKRLLQKCAYLMISHQELSAQQVCSYLLDYEDNFTSHKYNNLYWTSFEKLIDDEDPSPSCYSRKQVSTDNTDPENESDSDELDRYHSGEQDENEKEGDIDKEKMKATHQKPMNMTKFVSLSNRQEKLLQKQVK